MSVIAVPTLLRAVITAPLNLSRNAAIVLGVLAFHLLALWAIHTGLLARAVVVIVPVQMQSKFIVSPAPKPPMPQPVVPVRTVTKVKPHALPLPTQPLTISDNTTTPRAPVGSLAQPPALAPIAAPIQVTPAPVLAATAPAAPPKVELPSSDADYLHNAPPAYPGLSTRLGEQGTVVHRVLINVDGLPSQPSLLKSSGFERLDQAALKAILSWRYVPGTRNGVVTAMYYDVPITWEIN